MITRSKDLIGDQKSNRIKFFCSLIMISGICLSIFVILLYSLLNLYNIDESFFYVLLFVVSIILFLLSSQGSRTQIKSKLKVIAIYLVPLLVYVFTIPISYFKYTWVGLLLVVFIIYILHIRIHPYFARRIESEIKIKTVVIVSICSVILAIGSALIIISVQPEPHTLDIGLRDCDTEQFKGAISCKDQSGIVVTGSKVSCELINLELSNVSGYFNFSLLNGSQNVQNFTESIYFIAPERVAKVYIEMNATYDNQEKSFSCERNQTFATYEQYKQNRKDFFTYLAALIGFVLVAVPSIYKNWGEVFSNKNYYNRSKRR